MVVRPKVFRRKGTVPYGHCTKKFWTSLFVVPKSFVRKSFYAILFVPNCRWTKMYSPLKCSVISKSSPQKRFACSQCDMAFTGTSHLKRHMLTHTGVRPYSCSYCSKSYTQSNDLMKHLKIHLGLNVYRCDSDGCQEGFSKFFELKKHKESHYNHLIADDDIYVDEEIKI
jgi:uncharacterized Zn-finger protein